MSTTSNVVLEVPSNISEAQKLLDKRLLPAKLKVDGVEGKKNGFIFRSWVIAKGLVLSSMTGQAIAEELYQAIVNDCHQPLPQFQWVTPPKTLLARAEQSKGPSTRQDTRTAGDFEAKVRQSEEADKAQRAQEAAKKRATELVQKFAPINHRRGTLNYDLRDSKQKEWNARIVEAKNFTKLESEIREEQQDIYASLERAAERL